MITLAFTKNSVMEAFYTILVLIGYILVLIFLLRPLLVRSIQRTDTENGLSASIEYLVFWSLIVTACFFESLGVKAVFGGLLVGLIVPHQKGFAISLAGRLEDLVTVLFSPLFVVFSGFRIDLLIFRDGYIWFWMLMIFLVSVVGKLGGTILSCKFLLGLDIRESIATGLLVNSRGLLEIVVLNVGLDSGLISNQIYTLLMLQSVISTLLTVPILKLVFPPAYQLAKGDLDLATEKESMPPQHSPQLNVLFCLRSTHCVASMITLCQSMYEADPNLSAVVLRLIGLDERISGVMMANDYAITIQRDAAIQLFRSYGLLNNIKMQTLLTVTGKENFADDIVEASNGMQTSWIVCPIEFSKGLYPKGWGEEMYERLVENASCRVAVLLNRGFGVAANDSDTVFSAISAQTRGISAIVQGAHDDLAVCDFVGYMAQGSLYRISVHCIKPIDDVTDKKIIEKLNSFSNVVVQHYEFEPSIVSLAAKLHELCGHDLVIIGRELYGTDSENRTIRHWLDVISKASVLVVKEALAKVSTFQP